MLNIFPFSGWCVYQQAVPTHYPHLNRDVWIHILLWEMRIDIRKGDESAQIQIYYMTTRETKAKEIGKLNFKNHTREVGLWTLGEIPHRVTPTTSHAPSFCSHPLSFIACAQFWQRIARWIPYYAPIQTNDDAIPEGPTVMCAIWSHTNPGSGRMERAACGCHILRAQLTQMVYFYTDKLSLYIRILWGLLWSGWQIFIVTILFSPSHYLSAGLRVKQQGFKDKFGFW